MALRASSFAWTTLPPTTVSSETVRPMRSTGTLK